MAVHSINEITHSHTFYHHQRILHEGTLTFNCQVEQFKSDFICEEVCIIIIDENYEFKKNIDSLTPFNHRTAQNVAVHARVRNAIFLALILKMTHSTLFIVTR